jgi:hypothetical protein
MLAVRFVAVWLDRSNKDSRIPPSAHGNVTVDKLYESRYYEVKFDIAINR